jgi:hypothetical protein
VLDGWHYVRWMVGIMYRQAPNFEMPTTWCACNRFLDFAMKRQGRWAREEDLLSSRPSKRVRSASVESWPTSKFIQAFNPSIIILDFWL